MVRTHKIYFLSKFQVAKHRKILHNLTYIWNSKRKKKEGEYLKTVEWWLPRVGRGRNGKVKGYKVRLM